MALLRPMLAGLVLWIAVTVPYEAHAVRHTALHDSTTSTTQASAISEVGVPSPAAGPTTIGSQLLAATRLQTGQLSIEGCPRQAWPTGLSLRSCNQPRPPTTANTATGSASGASASVGSTASGGWSINYYPEGTICCGEWAPNAPDKHEQSIICRKGRWAQID